METSFSRLLRLRKFSLFCSIFKSTTTTMKFMQNKILLNSWKKTFLFLASYFFVWVCVDEAQSERRILFSAMHIHNILQADVSCKNVRKSTLIGFNSDCWNANFLTPGRRRCRIRGEENDICESSWKFIDWNISEVQFPSDVCVCSFYVITRA